MGKNKGPARGTISHGKRESYFLVKGGTIPYIVAVKYDWFLG